MKLVYELNFRTSKDEWYNLLYSSKKRANADLVNRYSIGSQSSFGIIEYSYVTVRSLC